MDLDPPNKPETPKPESGAYQPVPVGAAREIAAQYAKSVVIIFAWDPVHGLLHTTTYGRNPQEKAWAAQGGEIACKAMGGVLDESRHFEDYRLTQAKKLLAVLKTMASATSAFEMLDARLAAQSAIQEAEEFLGA